jgi:hypothetical protein
VLKPIERICRTVAPSDEASYRPFLPSAASIALPRDATMGAFGRLKAVRFSRAVVIPVGVAD